MALLESTKTSSWAVSSVLRDWCWGVIQVWVPPSGESLQACFMCSGSGVWEVALGSLLPPPPRAFRICSLRFQMVPAPAPTHFRFRASLQGPLHPTGAVPATPKMPYNVPKSSEVERGHLFLDLTVFFQELIFLLHFLRVSFSSPQF